MDSSPHSNSVAYLNCSEGYTSFACGPHVIRFRTPKSLTRYIDVRTWDHGYLVVGAQYGDGTPATEEYLDLSPILANLYFDAESFLAPIKEVRIA